MPAVVINDKEANEVCILGDGETRVVMALVKVEVTSSEVLLKGELNVIELDHGAIVTTHPSTKVEVSKDAD